MGAYVIRGQRAFGVSFLRQLSRPVAKARRRIARYRHQAGRRWAEGGGVLCCAAQVECGARWVGSSLRRCEVSRPLLPGPEAGSRKLGVRGSLKLGSSSGEGLRSLEPRAWGFGG